MGQLSLGGSLAGVIEKIKINNQNQVSLPPRDLALTDNQSRLLNQAIRLGWDKKEVFGDWLSGPNGYEPGPLIEINYTPNGKLTAAEQADIVAELKRKPSKKIVLEHLAKLAAHRKYTGGDGFAFVMADVSAYLVEYSELAIKNAMDELKKQDSPWFPTTNEILIEVKFQQKLIERLQ